MTFHPLDPLSATEFTSIELVEPPRSAPLDIGQPDGPSFTLDGNLVEWQSWSLRVCAGRARRA
ncbi:hypothetical protein E3O53_01015 [Cryobacterium sp. TMT2-18-3]|uniref:hypothetical protein n=1 Tax=unclassified Cryobacterium TaxID=2649013 RepID=UPI00106C8DE7|nr:MULTISPECIES: hypothetical protein [unclassified Cryobacterium]TFC30496.1 hypothetical protein E3O22_03735 [Cryobacterium sp. TMT2-18-2]TFC68286.1 hypothetical protein E3O53_01015 [Cryobacterium sp. TMT2-18-3]